MDQKVIVTAGASGIGAAIAEKFLSQGALVHIADINPVQALDDNSKQTSSITDVSNEDQVAALFEMALEKMGGLTTLVNCAGIAGPTAAIENVELKDWRACIAVNLDSTFLCSKYAVPHLKAARAGSIINISSTAGQMGYPMRSPYSSAKWALIGFTKTLAMELGPFGIRSNVICPGSVDGPRMDAVIAEEARQKGIDEETVRKGYTYSASLRTFISAQDIANMVAFLASPEAEKVSGQAIPVDGHIVNATFPED
ncbi:MAG: SDR family oxidoreductase [Rhodospirillaceae bacterium]|nr:SDR family oxidoreductase [Rhodospirillaceae bacterium]MBL6931316.1 SDR family oxidoreductase [Rhodospirillales bacterium]